MKLPSDLEHSAYHMLLRISALTLSLVLLFVSGIITPVTRQLSYQTGAYLAQVVAVGASVAPTELNTLTAQLTERQSELDEREQALREREIAVELNDPNGTGGDTTEFILSAILFILLVLIVLNYVLDFLRSRQAQAATA